MRATGFTHVSINAYDLDESVRFYQEFFGMEEIPALDFPFLVRWLRVGDPKGVCSLESWRMKFALHLESWRRGITRA